MTSTASVDSLTNAERFVLPEIRLIMDKKQQALEQSLNIRAIGITIGEEDNKICFKKSFDVKRMDQSFLGLNLFILPTQIIIACLGECLGNIFKKSRFVILKEIRMNFKLINGEPDEYWGWWSRKTLDLNMQIQNGINK